MEKTLVLSVWEPGGVVEREGAILEPPPTSPDIQGGKGPALELSKGVPEAQKKYLPQRALHPPRAKFSPDL